MTINYLASLMICK